MSAVETTAGTPAETAWYSQDPDAVVAAFRSDRDRGLTAADAAQRLAEHGPNSIAAEKPPSTWQVALKQLADPMNVMLVAVAIISLFINQVSVGILVGALVVLNIVLGTRQELKAKASVDALAKMQIPQAKVIRDGTLLQVGATTLVPGDIVTLEAGDLVPADGRIIRSATLETQ
jgi:Ca2+-transporting ATPase